MFLWILFFMIALLIICLGIYLITIQRPNCIIQDPDTLSTLNTQKEEESIVVLDVHQNKNKKYYKLILTVPDGLLYSVYSLDRFQQKEYRPNNNNNGNSENNEIILWIDPDQEGPLYLKRQSLPSKKIEVVALEEADEIEIAPTPKNIDTQRPYNEIKYQQEKMDRLKSFFGTNSALQKNSHSPFFSKKTYLGPQDIFVVLSLNHSKFKNANFQSIDFFSTKIETVLLTGAENIDYFVVVAGYESQWVENNLSKIKKDLSLQYPFIKIEYYSKILPGKNKCSIWTLAELVHNRKTPHLAPPLFYKMVPPSNFNVLFVILLCLIFIEFLFTACFIFSSNHFRKSEGER
jgi:hypothetical protein